MSSPWLREFMIPLDKDDLLTTRAGVYNVKTIVPLGSLSRAIDESRKHLQDNGATFIFDQFDTLFSVLIHSGKAEFSVTLRAFDRIVKGINQLVEDMEPLFENSRDMNPELQPKYRHMNKMYAYLLSSLATMLEDHVVKNSSDTANVGKKKKAAQKSDMETDWESRRQKALELIYRWFQLPLQKLWTPPIVEDLFISNLAQFCYKVLEQSRDAKSKYTRETIFEILGTLVKRYNQGTTCVVRVIQLVQLYDVLAVPLAAGVVHMVEETGCKSFITEMIREIGQNEPAEAEARNIATFLEALASSKPEFVLPIIDDLTEYLDNECYSLRNCVIGVLGAVVLGSLTGEEIDDDKRRQRDECLDNIYEHICDCNAYVRSKVLQVWQRLCCSGAVPLQRQVSLIRAVRLRLEDKSGQVRKQALQLLRALVQCNPFAGKFDRDLFAKQLEDESAKLKELKIAVAKLSTRGDSDRLELWKSLLPEIRRSIEAVLANEAPVDDSSSDEEDEEESEEANLIDAAAEFERIRNLLLADDITEAVNHLQSIFRRLPNSPNMHKKSKEDKKNCLLLCLQKIFEESETHPSTDEDLEGPAAATGQLDKEQAARKKNLTQRKEELTAKRAVVNYIQNCLDFTKELELAIPEAETLMFSTTAGVAIEACTFLGTASQFNVPNALSGVRKALLQVTSRDQSVRNNVASVYKEIYLTKSDENQSTRQKALTSVKGLIDLVQGIETGQSQALGQLVGTWRTNNDLGPQELQVMWEKFSLKIPDTRPIESRSALILLTMAAVTEPALVTDNLDVLIKVGLGPRAKTDLLLARDTCRALLKIRREPNDPLKPLLRYPNDHSMFQDICTLLIEGFASPKDNGYMSFAADALNAIYHLASCPSSLSNHVLRTVTKENNFSKQLVNENENTQQSSDETSPVQSTQDEKNFQAITRLLHIVGQIAIRELVHLDNIVYKELKRRNALREKKKGNNSSTGPVSTPASAQRTLRNKETHNVSAAAEDGEEALVGATADDADADLIINALETEIVSNKSLLAQYLPLMLDVCRHPEKYNDELLQTVGALALSKMMTVSSAFCVKHLQLLVTVMERSPHAGVRANVLIGLSDLTSRFPNKIEPWTGYLYGRLRDDDIYVRFTCVQVLSNLIMREMIRVKGQVSGLALCIIDANENIRDTTKQFFKDLSQKGNALYNIMPDILSHLMDPELNLVEKDFQEIIKYLLGLQQKERQIDTIIDKLCSRLKLATMERQWRDLAYCLSLLTFSGKSIRHLMDSLPQLKDKIHNKQVLKSLQTIIETTKKKPEAKTACIELEQKIEQLLESTENGENQEDDRIAMPPPAVPKRKTAKSRRNRVRHDTDSDEENDDDDNDNDNDDDDDDERGNNENTPPKSASKSAAARSHAKRKKSNNVTPSPSQSKRRKRLEAPSPSNSEESTPRRSARSKKRT